MNGDPPPSWLTGAMSPPFSSINPSIPSALISAPKPPNPDALVVVNVEENYDFYKGAVAVPAKSILMISTTVPSGKTVILFSLAGGSMRTALCAESFEEVVAIYKAAVGQS